MRPNAGAMGRAYVVLGDVVDSRGIEDREAFGRRLDGACRHLNEAFDGAIEAGLVPLKGIDEFAGVLSTPAPVYDVVDVFRARLHPQEARVAVAGGAIDVGRSTGDPARMDGEAFHRADDRLAEMEGTDFRFALDLEDPPVDALVADLVNMLLFRKRQWTDRQREVVGLYDELGDQQRVAEELGVSQPAVSRALSRADLQPIREIEHRLRTTLERYQ